MYWLTNGNNYHVEHHLYPNLPIDRLHELHDFIKKECIYISESYFQYYRGIILSIMRKGLHE
jgi:fatty acid desaturase